MENRAAETFFLRPLNRQRRALWLHEVEVCAAQQQKRGGPRMSRDRGKHECKRIGGYAITIDEQSLWQLLPGAASCPSTNMSPGGIR